MMGSKKCAECSKSIYHNDPQLALAGHHYHKACARCATCNGYLSIKNFATSGDRLLCKTHFKEEFSQGGGVYAGDGKFRQGGTRANKTISPASVARDGVVGSQDEESVLKADPSEKGLDNTDVKRPGFFNRAHNDSTVIYTDEKGTEHHSNQSQMEPRHPGFHLTENGTGLIYVDERGVQHHSKDTNSAKEVNHTATGTHHDMSTPSVVESGKTDNILSIKEPTAAMADNNTAKADASVPAASKVKESCANNFPAENQGDDIDASARSENLDDNDEDCSSQDDDSSSSGSGSSSEEDESSIGSIDETNLYAMPPPTGKPHDEEESPQEETSEKQGEDPLEDSNYWPYEDSSEEEGPPPLPPGWVEQMCPRTKMPFYLNTEQNVATWIRPKPGDNPPAAT